MTSCNLSVLRIVVVEKWLASLSDNIQAYIYHMLQVFYQVIEVLDASISYHLISSYPPVSYDCSVIRSMMDLRPR